MVIHRANGWRIYLLFDKTSQGKIGKGKIGRAFWPTNLSTSLNSHVLALVVQLSCISVLIVRIGSILLENRVFLQQPEAWECILNCQILVALTRIVPTVENKGAYDTSILYCTLCDNQQTVHDHWAGLLLTLNFRISCNLLVDDTVDAKQAFIRKKRITKVF